VQTIQPGTVVRVTLGETTQSDASGNRWNNREFTWDTDANSTILLPWEGTCVKTYFDGSLDVDRHVRQHLRPRAAAGHGGRVRCERRFGHAVRPQPRRGVK
jgi:hypothetical protein